MRQLGRTAAVALLVTSAVTACTGGTSGNRFTYRSATPLGTVIPVARRKPAEDIGGPLLSGGSASLAADEGGVTVVNFWASWCPPCKVELPQFDAAYRRLQSGGVHFLGVDTKDLRSKADAFVHDNDISFPIVYDEQGKDMLQLGNLPSAGLPITVLVDKHQRVAAVYAVRLSTKDLQPTITTLIGEQ
jgi:thiol-disulfide isomerase/thioredoxin